MSVREKAKQRIAFRVDFPVELNFTFKQKQCVMQMLLQDESIKKTLVEALKELLEMIDTATYDGTTLHIKDTIVKAEKALQAAKEE